MYPMIPTIVKISPEAQPIIVIIFNRVVTSKSQLSSRLNKPSLLDASKAVSNIQTTPQISKQIPAPKLEVSERTKSHTAPILSHLKFFLNL